MSLELTIGSDVSGLISGVNAAADRIAQLEQRIANLQRIAGNTTDFNKLNQAIGLIKTSQQELTRIQATAIPNFGRMATSSNELEKRIRIATSAEHEFNSILGATPALLSGAESPAQALGHEFLILATGVQRAHEAGQGFGSIVGTLGASMFSLQGAITLATAVLFGFGKELFGNKDGFDAAKLGADAYAASLEDLVKDLHDLKAALDFSSKVRVTQSEINNLKFFLKFGIDPNSIEGIKKQLASLPEETAAKGEPSKGIINAITPDLDKLEARLEKSKNLILNFVAGLPDEMKAKAQNLLTLFPLDKGFQIPKEQLDKLDSGQKQIIQSYQETFKALDELNKKRTEAQNENAQVTLDGQKAALEKQLELQKEVARKLKEEQKNLDFIPRDINAKLFVDTDLTPVVDVPKFKSDLEKGIPEIDDFHVKLGVALDTQIGNEKDVDALKKKISEATSFNQILDLNVQLNRISPFEGIKQDAAAAAKIIDGALTPAFEGMFQAIEQGTAPLKAFFKSLEAAVAGLITKLIQAALEAVILNAITGGSLGGVSGFGGFFKKLLGFAEGGHVSGPGSSTSDSIPAMLSNGEFVMKAAAVNKYGAGFMNAINQGAIDRSTSITNSFSNPVSSFSRIINNNISNVKHFAEGGLVTNFNSSNADVLFPTNRIRNLIGGSAVNNNSVNVSGKFRVDGKDLVLAISRQNLSDLRTT